MKMKTIEEKAKRFDEALNRCREFYETLGNAKLKEEVEVIFPELRESEDERIRKALINYFQVDGCICSNIPCKDIRAWLEKQGEQKLNVNDNAKEMFIKALERVEELNAKGYKLTDCDKNSWWEDFNAYTTSKQILANSAKTCNGEQKPAWSEKYIADVFEKVGLAKIAREQSNDTLTNALQDAMIELSKFTPQPKQEWSEEDEVLLKLSVENLTELKDRYGEKYGRVGECIDWLESKLESFKPQNTWKPSEGQLECLGYAIGKAEKDWSPLTNNRIYLTLKALKEQLEKL